MRNLKQLLQATRDRLSHLAEQEQTLTAELAVVLQEKQQVQDALDRIALIKSGEHVLNAYDCMYCFVLTGSVTEMKPVSSDTDRILLHCSGCGRDFEVRR